MYEARRSRSMPELIQHTKDGFHKYGNAEATVGEMEDALGWEMKYREEGIYAEVIDLTMLEADIDDENMIDDDVSDSDSDDDDDF